MLAVLGGFLIVGGTILLVLARPMADRASSRMQERNMRGSPWLRLNPWGYSIQAYRLEGISVVIGGVAMVVVGITV
jgi:hypothetical protein